MKWTGEKLLKLMEPIAKKYHLVHSEGDRPFDDQWSYADNTIEWVKEKRIPVDSEYMISININQCNIRIHDMVIYSYRLNDLSSNKLSQIIMGVLDLHKYSDEFVDRISQDTLVPTGKFYCWKKCRNLNCIDRLIKLEVPAKAKRYQALGVDKFRVSEAKVVGIYNLNYKKVKDTEVYSLWDNNFKYTLGKTIYPNRWDETETICSNGIHAYMNALAAKNH